MSAETGYLEPGGYPIMWPLLGGILLLAILVWLMGVYLFTRAPESGSGAPLPPTALAKARDIALGRIDEVEQEVRSGKRSARSGHHKLSTITRGFVAEATGLDADKMTAEDLRRRGPAHVAQLIETYYPRQFGAAESDPPSIQRSAEAARGVVGGWS